MSTDRLGIANVLDTIGSFLELRGENPFRVRAFRNAAKAVLGLPGSAAEALADGSLAATKGIGPATLAIVTELHTTGRSGYLEELKREVPPGLLEMLAIPGLGTTRIRALHKELRIDTLEALEAAARDGRLAALSGFGEKTAKKILRGIEFARGVQSFRLWPRAAADAEVLRSALAGLREVHDVFVAGEVRRACEVVAELSLVVVTETPGTEVHTAIAGLAEVESIGEPGDGVLRLEVAGGLTAGVRLTPPRQLGAALVAATGSGPHLALLGAHAEARGCRFSGALLSCAGASVDAPDEATFYRALGLAEIPPELREGGDEVARAARRELPRLVEPADLVGLVHCHSTWSDGTLGIAELAAACRDAGYEYLGLSDHSRSAAYAGGLGVDEVRRQWDEIDALNAKLTGFRVLKGIESDILGDGELDYDEATLAGFDFVIGSIHSRLGLSEAEMTARILRAMANPFLTVLGHPTGRLLLERNPYPLDLDRIFTAAAAGGIAIEINGHPHRLDLDWRLVRRASEQGVTLCVGADAHARAELENQRFAVGMARKGGLQKAQVLNTRPVDQFLAFARARRA